MSEFSSPELISAYVDNQLSTQEREEVDALLENSPEARAELESYRKLSSVLKSLPSTKASNDLARRVLAQAERQSLLGTSTPRSDSDSPQTSTSNRRWAISMAAFLATAALLFIALTQFRPAADQAELIATNESVGSVSEMESLAEDKAIADFSATDAEMSGGLAGESLPSELMSAPDRISVEFGENGLLKLINPQNLKTAEIGDTVEGWRFDEDRVVVVQLTVVDRDQVLNSMQVLLSDLSIPYEPGSRNSPEDENGDFYAVYVEADSEKMTTALRELQEDMNIGEILVSANVDSDDLNPYFQRQGYALASADDTSEHQKPNSDERVSGSPEPTLPNLPFNKPQTNAVTDKQKPSESTALSMEVEDTRNSDSLPPPPPLPEVNLRLSIARSSSPESYRQLQLRLPEAVANQMIYQQQSAKTDQFGQSSISNGFATQRAGELARFKKLDKPAQPAATSRSAKAPLVAGPESDPSATDIERKMALKELPIPVQVLFVLTPEQSPAAPARTAPLRK